MRPGVALGVGIREVLKVLRTLGVSRTAVHETKRT
jgi:hypothetical protein